jgi:hypothetical protein
MPYGHIHPPLFLVGPPCPRMWARMLEEHTLSEGERTSKRNVVCPPALLGPSFAGTQLRWDLPSCPHTWASRLASYEARHKRSLAPAKLGYNNFVEQAKLVVYNNFVVPSLLQPSKAGLYQIILYFLPAVLAAVFEAILTPYFERL